MMDGRATDELDDRSGLNGCLFDAYSFGTTVVLNQAGEYTHAVGATHQVSPILFFQQSTNHCQ